MAETLMLAPELGTDERFATNASRITNVSELERLIGECLDGIPADVARERLAVGRIATARVNDLQGVWEHEQLRARGRFVPVSTPSGTIELLASPFDISGCPPSTARVPALDEHDDATLDAVMRRGRGD